MATVKRQVRIDLRMCGYAGLGKITFHNVLIGRAALGQITLRVYQYNRVGDIPCTVLLLVVAPMFRDAIRRPGYRNTIGTDRYTDVWVCRVGKVYIP